MTRRAHKQAEVALGPVRHEALYCSVLFLNDRRWPTNSPVNHSASPNVKFVTAIARNIDGLTGLGLCHARQNAL